MILAPGCSQCCCPATCCRQRSRRSPSRCGCRSWRSTWPTAQVTSGRAPSAAVRSVRCTRPRSSIHGETVGRLRVSGRGRDDPLDADRPGTDRIAGPADRAGGPGRTAARGPGPLSRGCRRVARGRAAPAPPRSARRAWAIAGRHPAQGGPGRARRRRRGRRPGRCWMRSAPRSSRASPTSDGSSMRCARPHSTNSVWSVRFERVRLPWRASWSSTVTGPDQPPPAARRGRDCGVPDRGRGDDQCGTPQPGSALRGFHRRRFAKC